MRGFWRLQPGKGCPKPHPPPPPRPSRGSNDTTKTRSDPQRVRMSSGERPIGAAKGKQPNTEALCQPPLARVPPSVRCCLIGRGFRILPSCCAVRHCAVRCGR